MEESVDLELGPAPESTPTEEADASEADSEAADS
jgi:hypothetical protein